MIVAYPRVMIKFWWRMFRAVLEGTGADLNNRVQCGNCSGQMRWQDCPTGGWWIHATHPADDHDARV